MGFLSGISYNIRGLGLAIRTPKLLALGLIRFLAMILLTISFAVLVFTYHQEMLSLLWPKPEGWWMGWLWLALSWLVSLLMLVISALLSYLTAQIFFGAVIMDVMSQVTEKMITGAESRPYKTSLFTLLAHMIFQEIPRAILPSLMSILLMVLGWLTPLGPIISIISSLIVITFLAWDNTDIIPARQFVPFSERFHFLMKNLPFHVGFGLWFLIPVLNIIFFSFAPVGATLYHIDMRKKGTPPVSHVQ